MADEELRKLTVLLAGRPYPLKVQPSEEAIVRKVVKEINQQISQYQQSYLGKDKQDFLAMILLTYAVENDKNSSPPLDESRDSEILQRLKSVQERLSTLLP